MLNNQEPSTPVLLQDLGMYYPKETSKKKFRYGIYKCSCGKEFKAMSQCVLHGKTKSCGCYNLLQTSLINKSHGESQTRLYEIWSGIKKRINNPKSYAYERYGGRGIKLVESWDNDFLSFREWALSNGYEESLTIDRIDPNGNYEPSNCRWTTKDIQAQNTALLGKNNTSGYRGVSFYKRNNKWGANICVNSKQLFLGLFKTALEAAKAYDNYIKENSLSHTPNNA